MPGEDNRNPLFEQFLREQSIGEARGLNRLQRLVDIEIEELREKLKELEK